MGQAQIPTISHQNLDHNITTRSKDRGGLGFRDMKMFNQALLARQAWRLVAFTDSLCARLLKARYYPNGDLLDTAFPSVVSPTWKAIIFGLELLKKGAIWRELGTARVLKYGGMLGSLVGSP